MVAPAGKGLLALPRDGRCVRVLLSRSGFPNSELVYAGPSCRFTLPGNGASPIFPFIQQVCTGGEDGEGDLTALPYL